MKNSIYIIFATILFSSCESFFETTLELEEPTFVEQLNVNCILHNDLGLLQDTPNGQLLLLSKTVGLNERLDSSLVRGAEVNITYPDGSLCNMEDNNSQFVYWGHNYSGDCSDFNAEEVYELSVKLPDSELSASASVIMPMTVNFSDLLYLEEGGLNDDGDEVSAVDLVINDPAGVENFYKFSLIRKSDQNYFNHYYLETNDALAIESAIYSAILLSDDQFDGESYKLRLLFSDYWLGGNTEEFELILVASTISEDQYLYDKKLRQFQDNNDNPFASAIQLHDNIDGGLGIFAIENIQLFQVK